MHENILNNFSCNFIQYWFLNPGVTGEIFYNRSFSQRITFNPQNRLYREELSFKFHTCTNIWYRQFRSGVGYWTFICRSHCVQIHWYRYLEQLFPLHVICFKKYLVKLSTVTFIAYKHIDSDWFCNNFRSRWVLLNRF